MVADKARVHGNMSRIKGLICLMYAAWQLPKGKSAPKIQNNFSETGAMKGDVMIQAGNCFLVQLLLPAPDCFKEVIIVDHLDSNIEELNRWIGKTPDALDSTSAKQFMHALDKDRSSLRPLNVMEDNLRKSITQVLRCDVMKANPISPISIPQADCLFSPWYLEAACPDIKSFKEALKNLATLLKPGGLLVLFTVLGATFYLAGKYRFPYLKLDQENLRQVVSEAGFTIKELDVITRTNPSLIDVCDYTGFGFLVAHKEMGDSSLASE